MLIDYNLKRNLTFQKIPHIYLQNLLEKMAKENYIYLADEFFDLKVKAIMIKNHPYLAYEIFKKDSTKNFLNKRGHIRRLNIKASFCDKE